MKTEIKLFLITAILPLFMACEDKSNNELVNYQVDIATIQNPHNETSFFFRLDNKKLMWVDESAFSGYTPKDGQRIVANYTLLSDKRATHIYDYDVRLNDVYSVLTKGIFNVTKATQDSIGNDSIGIEDIWIGSDYLNVQFVYPGYNKTHFINLVNDTSRVFTDGKVHLFFRHNSNEDSPVYLRSGIVSFNIKSLQAGAVGTLLNLVIHVNIPNQVSEKTYDISYDFSSTSLVPKRMFPTLIQQKFY